MPDRTLLPINDVSAADATPEPATSRPLVPSDAPAADPMISLAPRKIVPLVVKDHDGDGVLPEPDKPLPSLADAAPRPDDTPALSDAERQQLLDDKTYNLPIITRENRRTRHVLVAGSAVIILLALAWLDIALDAGFVTINGLQPLTNFFGAAL